MKFLVDECLSAELIRLAQTRGQYADVALHAGLICLNGSADMNLDLQPEMFSLALDELERDAGMVNQALEITVLDTVDEIDILRYRLPAD